MLHFTKWIVLVFALIHLTASHASAQGIDAVRGAAAMCSELVQHHRYLFDENGVRALDRLNRSMRERLVEIEDADGDAQAAERLAQTAPLVNELTSMLEGNDALIDFVIEEGELRRPGEGLVQLPGDEGALILRVRSGEGSQRFSVFPQEYGKFPENRNWRFDAEANGETWILISLFAAPVERITVPVEFRLGDESVYKHWVEIEAPRFARVKFRFEDAQSGDEVPVMLQLVWQTNNRDRKPANAIEIAPQMDSQGSPSGRRMAQLPGDLAGPYWCVPGPFEMELPPGPWRLVARRGVEHVPLVDSFTLVPGETFEKTYQMRRWIDMRSRGWYSGDEHVHCRMISDSDADNVMAWARAEDIHVANVVKMGDMYRTWFEQRGWGPDYRVYADDAVLVPGQECPRTHNELGHTLHMNTRSMIRNADEYFLYDRVFEEVDRQGGLSGFCHVLFNMFHVHRGMAMFVPGGSVDYVEIMQFNQMGTEVWYDFLNLGFKITAAAGSDVPWGGTVGEVRTYAFLGDAPFSTDEWFNAFERGRTFVTNGPMIQLEVNGAMPGDELIVNEGDTLKITATAYGHPDRMVPTELEIVSQGEVLESVKPLTDGMAEISLFFDLPAGHGRWIAARAKGSDGSQAHTTPVYVVRPPFRFWNTDKAEDLIRARLASLQEIEDLIEIYRGRYDKDPNDYLLMQFVQQAPELETRLAEARRFYDELTRTLREEIESRR